MLSLSPSPFLFPWHCKCQPHPPRLSSLLSLPPSPSLFLSPCLSFHSKGRGGIYFLATCPFLWWQFVSLSAAHLLPVSASTLASWHHSFSVLLLLFNATFLSVQALLVCSLLGNCCYYVAVSRLRLACVDLHIHAHRQAASLPVGSMRNSRVLL